MKILIDHIRPEDATGALRSAYDRVAGKRGFVDNILVAHSLRPHTMTGHMALYKSVLHHTGNALPTWFLETIGVFVSSLNGCEYCFEHHRAGLERLVGHERTKRIVDALHSGQRAKTFSESEETGLRYVESLTIEPHEVPEGLIEAMRAAGLSDGEILEINQVASYFAYANRMVNGLGIRLEGDGIGLSPAQTDDPDDWEHD